MTTTLTQAHDQWANRPADERFGSLADMHAKATEYRTMARTATVGRKDLRADVIGGEVILAGKEGKSAHLTNWSFGQLARVAEAPPTYLRTLPADVAAKCINIGLDKCESDEASKLLFKANGDLTLRAITSDSYARIFNSDITTRLLELEAGGTWQPAPAAFDGSRGLYLGDRDMFAFMVDNKRRIFETANGGLSRGFFAWNSEVGSASFGVASFNYEYVCGNHRVWGAKMLGEVRIRHVGNAATESFRTLQVELKKYAESSPAKEEAKITACMAYELGKTKDEVLDRVFGLRVAGLSRKMIESGYDLAVKRVDWYGSPRSAWGLAGGITEIARDLPNADERTALDRAATKVMEIAF